MGHSRHDEHATRSYNKLVVDPNPPLNPYMTHRDLQEYLFPKPKIISKHGLTRSQINHKPKCCHHPGTVIITMLRVQKVTGAAIFTAIILYLLASGRLSLTTGSSGLFTTPSPTKPKPTLINAPALLYPQPGKQTYPRATKLRSGALLASLTVYDPDNAIQLAVSHDDGSTWAAHGTVLSKPAAEHTALDNSFLLELPSGKLLCAFRAHEMKAEALGKEEKPGGLNEGYLFFRLLVYGSDDGGRTWAYLSTAAEEPGPSNGLWEPFLRIAGADARKKKHAGGDGDGGWDGEVQFYYSREMGGGRDQDNLMRVSRDGGSSWSDARTVSGAGLQTRDGMVGIQEIGGEGSGELIAVFETVEEKGDGTVFGARFEVWSVMSRDGGASWGERRMIYDSWHGEAGDPNRLSMYISFTLYSSISFSEIQTHCLAFPHPIKDDPANHPPQQKETPAHPP